MARIGKSQDEKDRAGNAGNRAPRPPPAPSAASDLAPPTWLKRHRYAMVLWRRVSPDLKKMRWVAPFDIDVFARWCFYFDEWMRCNDVLKTDGMFIDTPMTGSTAENPKFMKRGHPIFKVRESAESHLIALEDRFGLSTLASLRIGAMQSAHGRSTLPLFDDYPDADPLQPAAIQAPETPAFGFLGRPN